MEDDMTEKKDRLKKVSSSYHFMTVHLTETSDQTCDYCE